MSNLQEGDVFVFQTNDDGDIEVENGLTKMTPGLGVAAYIALFGGNIDDDGRPGNPKTFWGNLAETQDQFKIVSRTQNLLESLPSTPSNLKLVESSVKQDLSFFTEQKIASSVDVFVSIPGLNKIKIEITIQARGEEISFEFTENWKAST